MTAEWELIETLRGVAEKRKAERDKLLAAARVVIARGEDEGWIHYNGTDESRLDVLEDAVESLTEADAVDPHVAK
jgi:hypothetical protein